MPGNWGILVGLAAGGTWLLSILIVEQIGLLLNTTFPPFTGISLLFINFAIWVIIGTRHMTYARNKPWIFEDEPFDNHH